MVLVWYGYYGNKAMDDRAVIQGRAWRIVGMGSGTMGRGGRLEAARLYWLGHVTSII